MQPRSRMLLFGIISAFPFLPVMASEVPALAEASYEASLAGWKCLWGCKTDNSLGNSSEAVGLELGNGVV